MRRMRGSLCAALVFGLALVSISCKKQPTTQAPAGDSNESPAAQAKEACEHVTQDEVEALFGHAVEMGTAGGKCRVDPVEAEDDSGPVGLGTEFSVEPFNDDIYNDEASDMEAVSGYGDKAHVDGRYRDEGIAEVRFIAEKGSQMLRLYVGVEPDDLDHTTLREKTLALAEKILANM